jgi:UDP-N-acetyl-D-galactosamine dehydrogenase
VIDIINNLAERGFTVDVHDAFADTAEAKHEYNVNLMSSLDGATHYDCVVGAVSHDIYAAYGVSDFAKLVADDGVIADVKGMWRDTDLPESYHRWQL